MSVFSRAPSHQGAFLATAGHALGALDLSASVHSRGRVDVIHSCPSVIGFELAHGREQERYLHNQESARVAREEQRVVVSQHAGFWDLFVPVGLEDAEAMIMMGPFLRALPSSNEILERWLWLTGSSPRANDPELERYLEITFATPVVDRQQLPRLQSLARSLAEIVAAPALPESALAANEFRRIHGALATALPVRKHWDIVASMIDMRSARSWASGLRRSQLRDVGVERSPNQLLVAYFGVRDGEGTDAVDALIRRHAFAAACTDLARRERDALCGHLGSRGVVLLKASSGGPARQARILAELGQSVRALGRKFGLSLHLGMGPVGSGVTLDFQFVQAARAARLAMLRRTGAITAAESPPQAPSLSSLRRQLVQVAGTRPEQVAAELERYADTAALDCGYALGPLRAHLELAFELLFETLGPPEGLAAGDIVSELEARARQAESAFDLVEAFRRAASQLVHADLRPLAAARSRSIERAQVYVREHYADRDLSLARAARVSGFAPGHFSQLFKREHGIGFNHYVRAVRIERAKQLLLGSSLRIERIAQVCGFRDRNYLHRVFRVVVGVTPHDYRQRRLPTPP